MDERDKRKEQDPSRAYKQGYDRQSDQNSTTSKYSNSPPAHSRPESKAGAESRLDRSHNVSDSNKRLKYDNSSAAGGSMDGYNIHGKPQALTDTVSTPIVNDELARAHQDHGFQMFHENMSREHAPYSGAPLSFTPIGINQHHHQHNQLTYGMYPGMNYQNLLLQSHFQNHPSTASNNLQTIVGENALRRSFFEHAVSHANMNSGMQFAHPSLNMPDTPTATAAACSNFVAMMTPGAASQPASSGAPGMSGSYSDPNLSGRCTVVLYMACDDDSLSEYQCMVRKQIELFEAKRDDVESNAQGRNRPIVMGQVGIRCRHCVTLSPKHRARGAIYYPAKLHGLYQAAQNMATSHLCEHCQHVPPVLRKDLIKLKDRKSSAGGGKKYWADGVRILGVYEDEDGLRFEKR